MNLRIATPNDLEEITQLFELAKEEMIKHQIYQWDELYPNAEDFLEDINKQEMYVAIQNNTIVSTVVVNDEYDEQYQNGSWKYETFKVIHRLCVHPHYQNQRLGRTTIEHIEQLLKSQGINSIRLDAFSQNPYALKMYDALHYRIVGKVHFRKGMFYLMEKKLI